MSSLNTIDRDYWKRVNLYIDSIHAAGNLCFELFQRVYDEYESLHWWNIFKQDRLLRAMKTLTNAETYLVHRLVEEADEAIH